MKWCFVISICITQETNEFVDCLTHYITRTLADMVTGTCTYTSRQLYGITLLLSLFCFTADGNIYQYQYKAAANVAKPSHDPSETFMITHDVYSVSVSPYRGSARFPNCPKCSVTHLRWSYSAASSRYMQFTTTNKGGYHAQHNLPVID